MSVFLLSYDLTKKKPEFDYQVLWDELKRLGSVRIQESVWLTELNVTAKELRNHLQTFIHENDLFWVSAVRKNQFAFSRAKGGTKAWLESNPPN